MELQIRKEDVKGIEGPTHFYVDRDGVLNNYLTQGLYVGLTGMMIRFEDEMDALKLAEQIAWRPGKKVVKDDDMKRPRPR